MIHTHIGGIPCCIEILFWAPAQADVGYECDWVVRDRCGKAAIWLQRKLTKADIDRIDGEVFRHMTRGNHNDD